MEDLPPLSSQDMAALFDLDVPSAVAQGPYQQAAPWLLDPSPAGSGEPDLVGDLLSPNASVAGLPPLPPLPAGMSLMDPFLMGAAPVGMAAPSYMPPLPMASMDTFAPLAMATDSGGSGSGAGSMAGGAGPATAVSTGAQAVLAAPKGRARGGARGAAGGKKELTEEQKERIKAKNRRAQNRYREKQKAKAAATEDEFQRTADELQRLRLENSQLQAKQSAMQQVLTVREDFMGALEGGKAADKAGDKVGPLPCGCASREVCQCLQPGTNRFESKAITTLCTEITPGLPEDEDETCPLTGLTLSEIADLKRKPPELLQREWRSLAQRLSSLLQQLEAAQATADTTLAVQAEQIEQKLRETLMEGQSFCFEHAVYQPTSVQKLFAASLDDGRSRISHEDMQHWEGVAAALQLSDMQLERLAAARASFLRKIADVCDERRAIFARLQEVELPDSSEGLKALQLVTASWLKVHESTSDLAANMEQEHCVCMTFLRDAFGYVMSPYQKAVAIVRSQPFFPDVYSIATVALQSRKPALLAGPEQRKLLPTAAAPPAPPLEAVTAQ